MLADISAYLTLVIVAIFVFWIVRFVYPYLNTKAANLAQKEDVQTLTGLVEEVRAEYTNEIERLKSRLEQVSAIHRIQFEVEFRAYQELWLDVFVAFRAYIRMRPATIAPPKDADTEFFNAQQKLTETRMKFQPFIPAEVHQKFVSFDELILSNKIDVVYDRNFGVQQAPDEIRQAKEALEKALAGCGDAIRQRLSTILVE